MINAANELEGYIEVLNKSLTRHENMLNVAYAGNLETLIEKEIKRAYEQPLKLEILASMYFKDFKHCDHMGLPWRTEVYHRSYKHCLTLENELYADFEPIFLDGQGWFPYGKRNPDDALKRVVVLY